MMGIYVYVLKELEKVLVIIYGGIKIREIPINLIDSVKKNPKDKEKFSQLMVYVTEACKILQWDTENVNEYLKSKNIPNIKFRVEEIKNGPEDVMKEHKKSRKRIYPQLNNKAWLINQVVVQKKSVTQIRDEIHATFATIASAIDKFNIPREKNKKRKDNRCKS